ncbi:sodium channel protein Nach-like isoform X2 [Bicyclus anynana]|uniref:Sodium channel protein Nach-like isoform X2 n=1 Tax=Bicyclus anynana TaxID=110368 RepID=A0ABM3M6S3_BICAN|nr:sodium channel protein Nach-like isoform X2 [Bicyclus anynana]
MVYYRHHQKLNMKYNLKNKTAEPPRTSLGHFAAIKFKEFCARTDLHGFKYITKDGLNVAERTVWAVVVGISIICAGFLLVTAYRWYAKNPIVTVVETTQGVIWDIPFPAVTLCDMNIVSKSAARRLSLELMLPENVTSDFVFKTLRLVPLLHSLKTVGPDEKRELNILQDVLELNKITMKTLFKRLSSTNVCSNILERCMWKNTIYHCNQIFRHTFVSVHQCCTFNYYAVNDEDNELKVFRFSLPRRVASCGYQTALTVVVKTDPTDYYSSNHASLGSLVFVDNAYNVPDLDSPMRVVNPSSELLIAVSAERTYATSGIRSFPVYDRHCYYTDEIEIPNIKQYSFHNCRALRRMQLMVKLCDCVPFYFPKRDRNRICNFNDIECLESLSNMTYIQGLTYNNITESVDKIENDIECLPECEHFSYPLQVGLGTISNRVPLSGIEFYCIWWTAEFNVGLHCDLTS